MSRALSSYPKGSSQQIAAIKRRLQMKHGGLGFWAAKDAMRFKHIRNRVQPPKPKPRDPKVVMAAVKVLQDNVKAVVEMPKPKISAKVLEFGREAVIEYLTK